MGASCGTQAGRFFCVVQKNRRPQLTPLPTDTRYPYITVISIAMTQAFTGAFPKSVRAVGGVHAFRPDSTRLTITGGPVYHMLLSKNGEHT